MEIDSPKITGMMIAPPTAIWTYGVPNAQSSTTAIPPLRMKSGDTDVILCFGLRALMGHGQGKGNVSCDLDDDDDDNEWQRSYQRDFYGVF